MTHFHISRKQLTALLLSVLVLAVSVGLISSQSPAVTELSPVSPPEGKPPEVSSPSQVSAETQSFVKAVWVPFMSLNLAGTDRTEQAARKRLTEIFDKIRSAGADTVFLHVHPFCDALYKSKSFPSSHLLSGQQGKNVNYDFLAIAVTLARQRGLKLHAWMNPLRVSYNQTPSAFAENNPYVKWQNDDDIANDRYTFESNGNIYLNAAYPAVRRLITDEVRELVSHYDIDGVVIDDYFYPPDDMECDRAEYDLYCDAAGETYLSQANWRKGNINTLVSAMYSAVHFTRADCQFGISPQCNLSNNEKISADVVSWGKINGYADYLSPQTYVSQSHPYLPFDSSVDQWRSLVCCPDTRLYISLALYKVGTDADNGTWLLKKDNISSQIDYARKAGADGYALYSYQDIDKL